MRKTKKMQLDECIAEYWMASVDNILHPDRETLERVQTTGACLARFVLDEYRERKWGKHEKC